MAFLLPVVSLLGACGGAAPISMSCRATSTGTAWSAAVELRNDTDASITVQGMSVPWLYRHAAHFSSPSFSDPHVITDPGEYETLILLPGESTGGEIPLGDRLVDSFGRSIEESPGEHEVEMRSRLVLDPDTSRRRNVDARCTFDVTVAAP